MDEFEDSNSLQDNITDLKNYEERSCDQQTPQEIDLSSDSEENSNENNEESQDAVNEDSDSDIEMIGGTETGNTFEGRINDNNNTEEISQDIYEVENLEPKFKKFKADTEFAEKNLELEGNSDGLKQNSNVMSGKFFSEKAANEKNEPIKISLKSGRTNSRSLSNVEEESSNEVKENEDQDSTSQEQNFSLQPESTFQEQILPLQEDDSGFKEKSFNKDSTSQEKEITLRDPDMPPQEEEINLQNTNSPLQEEKITLHDPDLSPQEKEITLRDPDLPPQAKEITPRDPDLPPQEEEITLRDPDLPPQEEEMKSEKCQDQNSNSEDIDNARKIENDKIDANVKAFMEEINAEEQSGVVEKEQEHADDQEEEMLRNMVATGEVPPVEKKKLTEIEKCWKVVRNSTNDFQAWTSLLTQVEKNGELEEKRSAYDEFLSHYPLCYGYWKKYADVEKKGGTEESVLKAFERGFQAIKLSVDLWVHYMNFVLSKYGDEISYEDYVRTQFEFAVSACGLEFKSDKLWDLYIGWEVKGERWMKVTAIYTRLIATPTTKHHQHFNKFQDFIKAHSLEELLTDDEFTELKNSIQDKVVVPERTEDPEEGDSPPGVEGSELPDPRVQEQEKRLMRAAILESNHKIYDKNLAAVKQRWGFEDSIKRPYFHVKPLEKSQLKTWRNYLDYEIKHGDQTRVLFLFERCLIACAYYEEFWIKYIGYLEKESIDADVIGQVYARACNIHLKDKIKINLLWCSFEAGRENYTTCFEILEKIQKIPKEPSLEIGLTLAAVKRQSGDLEGAEQTYLETQEKFEKYPNKSFQSCIALKYARFLSYYKDESEKSVEVLTRASGLDKKNSNILLALADHAMLCRPPLLTVAADALKKATDSGSSSTRLRYANRYVQFLTEFQAKGHSLHKGLLLVQKIENEIQRRDEEKSESRVKESSSSKHGKQHHSSSSEKGLLPHPGMNGSMPPGHAPNIPGPPPFNPAYGAPYNQGYMGGHSGPPPYGGGGPQQWNYDQGQTNYGAYPQQQQQQQSWSYPGY